MSDDSRASAPTHTPRGKTPRERLDVVLTQRGLAPSRERARALIMAREVKVDGRMVEKAGTLVPLTAEIEVVSASELRYVGRGGLKLERALDVFSLDPAGKVALDVGASTGGFTDVLLRRGAVRVYAVDVGHGQLAWSLREDPRVVVLERTNIRHLESLPERADCTVIDVSFISLRLVLPRVATLTAPGGWVVALVKPQFEAGRAEADRGGGVISDSRIHERVLTELLAELARQREQAADGLALVPRGLIPSPIVGREGNHEYLLHMALSDSASARAEDVASLDEERVRAVVREAFAAPQGASP